MADLDENVSVHDDTEDDESSVPTTKPVPQSKHEMRLNTRMLDSCGEDGTVTTKENGPEAQLSRRSTTSHPLGEIASGTNTPRAFFDSSSKRLLKSQDDDSGSGSVSWLSNTFSADSSKAPTVEANPNSQHRICTSNASSADAANEKQSVSCRRDSLPPRLDKSQFESIRSGGELLREAGTSFADEGTSVVSSWLEDATATGIFRSLHVNSEELSCGIPIPPSSNSNSSSSATEEPVYSLGASSSWSKDKADLTTPKNQSPKADEQQKVQSASAMDMKQFDQAYDIWRRKGLLSDEKRKPIVEARQVPTVEIQQLPKVETRQVPNVETEHVPNVETSQVSVTEDITNMLFEPDPSVASCRKSKASSKTSSTSGSSKIQSSRTADSSVYTGSLLSKGSKSRRETLAVVNKSINKHEPRKHHRQSLPATSQERAGFADILKSWQTKSANKPCPHFLSPQQNLREETLPATAADSMPAAAPEERATIEKVTQEGQSLILKSVEYSAPPKLASASPAVSLRSASPLNRSEAQVNAPPKSQAWKLKRQSSDRILSATSSAATKTAQNEKSLATSTHWSFGRSSSRGRSENGSEEVVDKYTSVRHSSEGSRRDNEIYGAIPKNISVSGASTPNEENALRNFANATNRLSEYFEPPRSVDSESTATPTIPREVAIALAEPKNPDALLSPFTTRVVRNLEKMYNQADEVRTPAEKNFSNRPWRRDSLVSKVDHFQDKDSKCQCICSESVFSGNDEMIEFFLPLMGTACTCGQRQPGLVDPKDPTSLVNILRPWQVEFLGSFGIYRGDELVKANHRSAAALATALRKYRKKIGMTPFRTKSCGMALQIWARTSKAFVRSIRSQLKAAEDADGDGVELVQARELRLPNALYIVSAFLDSMPSDIISQGPGSSAGCDQTLTSTITGSHSSGDGANWSTITPGATVEGEI